MNQMDSSKPELVKLKIPNKQDLANKDQAEYSEVEKMVSSVPFDFKDQTLLNGQAFAKTILRKINTSDPLDTQIRHDLFTQLLGIKQIAPNLIIESF